jgi:hypothetical protein
MIGSLQVDGPEVTINRRPAIVIKSPIMGNGWLAAAGCCKPNIHRDLRIAIDGRRIETGETFAIDWSRVKNDKIYDRYYRAVNGKVGHHRCSRNIRQILWAGRRGCGTISVVVASNRWSYPNA